MITPHSPSPEEEPKPQRQLEFDFEQLTKDAERAEDERVFAQMDAESGLPAGALDFSLKLHRHFHGALMTTAERKGRAARRKIHERRAPAPMENQSLSVPEAATTTKVTATQAETADDMRNVLTQAVSKSSPYILPVEEGVEIDGKLLAPLRNKMSQMVTRYESIRNTLTSDFMGWRLVVSDLGKLRDEMIAAHVRLPDALKFAQWGDMVSVDGQPERIAARAFLDFCDVHTTNSARAAEKAKKAR